VVDEQAAASEGRQARLRLGLCSASEFRLLERQAQTSVFRTNLEGTFAKASANVADHEICEPELHRCMQPSTALGLQEEACRAKRALDQLDERHLQHHTAEARLLDALTSAAASGDATAIRFARDQAREGGVSLKTIARTLALRTG